MGEGFMCVAVRTGARCCDERAVRACKPPHIREKCGRAVHPSFIHGHAGCASPLRCPECPVVGFVRPTWRSCEMRATWRLTLSSRMFWDSSTCKEGKHDARVMVRDAGVKGVLRR